jgi:hypothetical protein
LLESTLKYLARTNRCYGSCHAEHRNEHIDGFHANRIIFWISRLNPI